MFALLYSIPGTQTTITQALAITISKMLCRTLTDTSQLDASKFNIGKCQINNSQVGSAWTVVYDNSIASGNGTIILSKACLQTNKTNYFAIVYSTYVLYVQTGNAVVGNTLSNATATNTVYLCQSFYVSTELAIGFRSGNNFVHCWNAVAVNSFIGFEAVSNAYDRYSLEGSFKLVNILGSATPAYSLHVSSMYIPSTESHLPNGTILPSPDNISEIRTTAIGISKGNDAITNSNLLVPLIFRDLTTGWLGCNVSAIAGVYFSTSGLTESQIIDVGGKNYYVVPMLSCATSLLSEV